jgi:23S rRNA (cytidine1920-2'-O)/16S rRNA (cytidine1409-2'-O)-methyltransferase
VSPLKQRLDVLLVDRRLAASRERAQALILAHQVLVDGQVVSKAGTAIPADARIELKVPDHPYVGRGGVKLAGALDALGIDPAGRQALDIGASTGGFVDVLLRRGVSSVIALDVGHGQLDWRFRNDQRVIVREGVNARALTSEAVPHHVDLVTIDVSFISLRHILPSVRPFLTDNAEVVALVKPQFEAGRDEVGRGGIVSDSAVHEAVITQVTAVARAVGLTRLSVVPSTITGATGNQEFFIHLVTAHERETIDGGLPPLCSS